MLIIMQQLLAIFTDYFYPNNYVRFFLNGSLTIVSFYMQQEKKYTSIIFDLGGVLVYSEQDADTALFHEPHTPILEGMALLKALQKAGYKTYILSNITPETWSLIENSIPELQEFDGKILSFEVNCRKPSPSIYKILLSTYNLNAQECFFFDDRLENIVAAQDIGIDGVLTTNRTNVAFALLTLGIKL